jgi:hypothetical protein
MAGVVPTCENPRVISKQVSRVDLHSPPASTMLGAMRNTLEIQDAPKLRRVLQIFSALDSIRWSDDRNYNLINYCVDDLTPDERLLTHWLCYITDRQTGFERIWDVGGYVLSHLARAFTKDGETPRATLDRHISAKADLRLNCPLVKANRRLIFYEIHEESIEFASRYMPTDMLSIYRTLFILEQLAGRGFARFIYLAVHSEANQVIAVSKLAAALHFLTYTDIGTPKADKVRHRMDTLEADLEEDLSEFRSDPETKVARLVRKFKPFGKKRLWCSIRDYLKSGEFNNHLVAALEQIDPMEARRWRRQNIEKAALATMELPGDVWNNNRIFREGLFSPHLGSPPKMWDMPRTIREIYRKVDDQDAPFYPEQLDVTFDFVPRMCDRFKCDHCIFGGGIGKLCHQQHGFYCPVVLDACGYFYPCQPDKCAFKADSVRGLCQSPDAE